jgi:hypothetical protein
MPAAMTGRLSATIQRVRSRTFAGKSPMRVRQANAASSSR